MDSSGRLRSLPTPHRRGFSAVFAILVMVALAGMVSLGVDLGRVYAARTELQTAADAAARAAAAALRRGASTARSEAIDLADDNTSDGQPVVLTNADIEFGDWNAQTRVFTPVSGSAENSAQAVRVTARKLASRGTAVPLTFARLVGRETLDLQVSAVAIGPVSAGRLGVIGIDGVVIDSNSRVDSYDSADGNYSSGSAGSEGNVYSNGNITLKSNSRIDGDAVPGPGRTVNGGTVTGSRDPSQAATTYPPVDASPYATNNDNSKIPAAFRPGQDFLMDGNNTLNLSAGTYSFRNFTMRSNTRINVSGNVTIYVTGAFTMDSNSRIDAPRPQNVRVNVDGTGDVSLSSNTIFEGVLYAPEADVTLSSNVELHGAVVGKTLHLNSNVRVHFDESLNSGPGAQTLRLVY